jgi:hypothetical protein
MFSAATKSAHGPATDVNYIESVFSTYLYTGNDATQTINNDIDLSGKGGLVWIKPRDLVEFHSLFDTTRGAGYYLSSSQTSAQSYGATTLTSFNSNGFSLGGATRVNGDPYNNVSWTFRKQPKFFDVITYTGTGSNTTISHNLGSVPGMIFVKRTDTTANWQVYHRSLANTEYIVLNTTAAVATGTTRWNSTTPTSTEFSLGTDATVNASGGTYVAYLFAHDAGGFGTTGTDNVISCGSFTTDSGANATVNLGYEPQWVIFKRTNNTSNWAILDNMRGWSQTQGNELNANTSGAEGSSFNGLFPTATGFVSNGALFGSSDYIYMAIRRPMKMPTDATTVFKPVTLTPSGATTVTTGFPVDLIISGVRNRGGSITNTYVNDRLRGGSTNQFVYVYTNLTDAEGNDSGYGFGMDNNTATIDNVYNTAAAITTPCIYWNFSRRPGFFDVVCYTGTGSNTTQAHNLGVVPELIIVKRRNSTTAWDTYSSALANTEYVVLNTTAAVATGATRWNSTTPTASVFSIGTSTTTNASGGTYVAYLFATCAGVSKVGSYTGNGTTQAISCGFTGGARFVLIKRTDSTGDWYVYDTARGMTLLTDPYLRLNSTAAESATLGSVITSTGGFTVDATILAAVNTSGASYIFLAIA